MARYCWLSVLFLIVTVCTATVLLSQDDDFSEIQSAIDRAIADGTKVVSLDADRVYRLGVRKEAAGALRIFGGDGLTIEGNGAVLMGHPSCQIFAIAKSNHVVLRNLQIDYDPLPYTQARIIGIAPEQGQVTLTPLPGYDPPDVSENYPVGPWSDVMFFDGKTRHFIHYHLRLRSLVRNEDGNYVAMFHDDPGHVGRVLAARKPGDMLVLKKRFERGAPLQDKDGRFLAAFSGAIRVAYCKNVLLENVTLFAAPSMAFVGVGSEGIVLDRYRVMRKPGTDRLVSSCSDGAHLKSVSIMPQLKHCLFEGMMDDGVNVKISSAKVIKNDGKTLLITHNDILYDDIAMEPGMRVSFYDFAQKAHLGFARIKSVKRPEHRIAEITLDTDVSRFGEGVSLYTVPETDLVVYDCTFRTQFNNALLIRPQARVEQCLFENVCVGIHAIAHEIIEGPMPPGRMTVSHCTFLQCGHAVALMVPSPDALPDDNDYSSLDLSSCYIRLKKFDDLPIQGRNQRGIHIRDVKIDSEDGIPSAASIFDNCQDVRMSL